MRFFFLFLLLFSGIASAETFWVVSSGATSTKFPDAQSACESFNNFGFVFTGDISYTNDTHALCRMKGGGTLSISSQTHNCATGSSYDLVTGKCVAGTPSEDNKCAILKDTVIPSFHWSSSTDMPASTISIKGCGASISGITLCKSSIAGGFRCTGTATITGDQLEPASSGAADECSGAACTAGDPQKETKDDPCSMIPVGSGFTCTATQSESDPGKGQCGSANGAWVCVENPYPVSAETKSTSNMDVVNNADGSTTTKTTTITDTTTCKGIGNCTTSTSTTTTTGGKNADGSAKPDSSSCVGARCGAGGKAETGPGKGEEGNDQAPPTVTALTKPEQGNFDGEEDKWDKKIEDSKTQMKDNLKKISDLFKPVGNLNLGSGGGALYCPPPVEVLNTSISFCLDKYADSLSWISAVVLAMCAIIALFIVFK